MLSIIRLSPMIVLFVAYSGSQSAPPAQPPTGSNEEIEVVAKKLCAAEPVIGTRIPVRRKCSSPEELAQYRQQARELIENYLRRPCMAGTESGEGQVMPC